jgi:hypothetical protein
MGATQRSQSRSVMPRNRLTSSDGYPPEAGEPDRRVIWGAGRPAQPGEAAGPVPPFEPRRDSVFLDSERIARLSHDLPVDSR